MPFVLKKYTAIKGKKIQQLLLNEVNLTMSISQKLLAKKEFLMIMEILYKMDKF